MSSPAAVTVSPKGLEVNDLHVYYGDSHVLQGCCLTAGQECVAVLGRNGMGKTTLLRAIMGLAPPHSGSIRWCGEDIAGRKPYRVAGRGIGYVPQGRRVFPSLSVEEHLTLAYRRVGAPDAWTPQRVFDMFPEIAQRARLSGARLSGGEQQMLAIGRALVTNPRLILLDEPSEGLAPVAVDRVVAICHRLRSHGIAILLVEQNIHAAEALAQRVYVLVSGRMVHESTMEQFVGDRELRQRYLGV